jgi:hypothetical protein
VRCPPTQVNAKLEPVTPVLKQSETVYATLTDRHTLCKEVQEGEI